MRQPCQTSWQQCINGCSLEDCELLCDTIVLISLRHALGGRVELKLSTKRGVAPARAEEDQPNLFEDETQVQLSPLSLSLGFAKSGARDGVLGVVIT